MTRGGKREGAGRKKAEPTKRISVPEILIPEIESMMEEHRDMSYKPLPEDLLRFIEMFPEYENNQPVLSIIGVLFEDWELLKQLPRNHRKVIIKMLQKS